MKAVKWLTVGALEILAYQVATSKEKNPLSLLVISGFTLMGIGYLASEDNPECRKAITDAAKKVTEIL